MREQFDSGEIGRITGLPDHSATRVLADVVEAEPLGSGTPKGPVSTRFPVEMLDVFEA